MLDVRERDSFGNVCTSCCSENSDGAVSLLSFGCVRICVFMCVEIREETCDISLLRFASGSGHVSLAFCHRVRAIPAAA